MHGLLENAEVRLVGAAVGAGSTIDDKSSRIDMAGYESVMFVTTILTSANGGVATLAIQENDVDSNTGMADIAGTLAAMTAGANDALNNKLLVSEVYKPMERYVLANRRSATANISYGQLFAILIPHRKPSVQGATVGATARAAN